MLKEPRANLYDNARKKIGKHYAGPTWESKDGSKVVGKLKQSVPAPKADNIPWLLVEAQSHEGKGIFSEVSYILRVDTVGGVAPAYPPTVQGQEKQVPYKATYISLAPTPIKLSIPQNILFTHCAASCSRGSVSIDKARPCACRS